MDSSSNWKFVCYGDENNPNYKNGEILNILLIIAAGGNGACFKYKINGIDGLCNMIEKRDNYFSNGQASRGASFKNDFHIFKSYKGYNKYNPKSFVDGAIGGGGYGRDGGFGGGGMGDWEGGDGYIGGLVSKQDDENEDIKKYSSYGALSFNCCKKNIIAKSGCNASHGKIEVQFV